MFNHSIQIVQIHKTKQKNPKYRQLNWHKSLTATLNTIKVYILPNNKTYKHYFIA